MIPQELRIGNFIKDVGETQDIYTVSEITLNSFTAGPMTVFRAGFEFDHGIPITEEWLLKFGFKREDEFSIIYLEVNALLRLQGNAHGQVALSDKRSIEQLNVRCEYVHQLQNLYFALTGEELIYNQGYMKQDASEHITLD
jgi:hypothetical protein